MTIINVQANFVAHYIGRISVADQAGYDASIAEQLDRAFATALTAALAEHGACIVGRVMSRGTPDLSNPYAQSTIYRRSVRIWPLGSGNNEERQTFLTRYCE